MPLFLGLAWRNIWRNWRRTGIALLAIVLGLMLLVVFDAFIQGSDQAIFGNAVRLYGGNLQIHADGFREKSRRLPLLPVPDVEQTRQQVSSLPEVQAAASRINTAGIVRFRGEAQQLMITAIDPILEAPLSLQAERITQGRFLSADDRDVVLIGQGLAQRLKAQVGDRITVIGRSKQQLMRQHQMQVVGIFDLGMPEVERSVVYMPLADAQTLYNLREQATEIAIFLRQVGTEEHVAQRLQAQWPDREVDSWQTLRPEITETLRSKLAYTNIFGIVVLLIASIGIFNLMMMSVFERTREIGMLAALGMKRWQLTGLFLLEGVMIGGLGAAIGCSLAALLVALLGRVGIDLSGASAVGEVMVLLGSHLYPSITLADLLSRGVLVLVITTLACCYPAWQAARREPASALHYV